MVDQLGLEKVLQPVLDLLETIMSTPKPQLRTHNVVFVPIGSKPQKWHIDDVANDRKLHKYFTILVHLNSLDSNSGGTEIWMEKQQCGDLVSEWCSALLPVIYLCSVQLRARPGDALVFNGSLMHRGHANNGKGHRFFYYASFACKRDNNDDTV